MGKFVSDDTIDALLNRVKTNGVKIVLCDGQPANYNEAVTNKGSTVSGGGTARQVGNSTIGPTDFTGPGNSTLAGLGRKLTVNQIAGVSISVTSTNADYVAIVTNSTGAELLLVTPLTSALSVSTGVSVTINSFDHIVQDPV